MGVIYKATSKTSGKSYVGKSYYSMEIRREGHRQAAAKESSTVFHKAIRKYGFEDFTWSVIFDSRQIDECSLNSLEIEIIKEENTKVPNGYNLTDGGEGMRGYSPDEKTRFKMGSAFRGKYLTAEHKEKIRISNLSRDPVMLERIRQCSIGRKHTDAAKIRMSVAAKSKLPTTDETRQKMSESQKNVTHTKEWNDKISQSKKGKKRQTFSAEWKMKMSLAQKKRQQRERWIRYLDV